MQIAVVEGDGIGHEVIPVARDVLGLLRPDFEFIPVEVGFGRWKQTGEALGNEEIEQLRSVDAVFFGAVTTPPSPDYQSVVVRIRKSLDLYSNVRPIKGQGTDITVVRENTEGLYSGIENLESDRATTLRVVTRHGSERIARFACTLAKGRKVTIGHKANVLKSDVFFREICIRELEKACAPWNERYIDNLCLDVLLHPAEYHVIVTTNLFGDILSDVAAYLVGGLGLLPSANIGERHALFEPVHGSAPDIAGKGIANPIAAIRSAAMLLEYFGDRIHARMVEDAIQAVLSEGIITRDLGGTAGTTMFGKAVLRTLSSCKPA